MLVIATRAKTYYFFTGVQNYAKNKKLLCHAGRSSKQKNIKTANVLNRNLQPTSLSVLLIIFTCQTCGKCFFFG